MRSYRIALALAIVAMLAMVSCSDHFNVTDPQSLPAPGPALNLDGVTIDSAIFTVYVFGGSSGTVNVNRMLVDWAENVVTWNSLYGGGFNTGQFDNTVIASFDAGVSGFHNLNITSLVQGWMDGTFPNYGFALTKMTAPLAGFTSSEWATISQHPMLTIYFTDSGGQHTIVIQRGVNGTVADTYVREPQPDVNFGSADEIFSGLLNDLIKQSLFKFEVPTIETGCTRTIGYWKTHAGFGPQPDVVSALLPIDLGTPAGVATLHVTTALIAYNVLSQNVYGTPSNGITKLYAQLLGAKLNIENGASDADVAATIAASDAFLATHDWTTWNGLSQADKNMVLGWQSTLDNYNNGFIGPGHCD